MSGSDDDCEDEESSDDDCKDPTLSGFLVDDNHDMTSSQSPNTMGIDSLSCPEQEGRYGVGDRRRRVDEGNHIYIVSYFMQKGWKSVIQTRNICFGW